MRKKICGGEAPSMRAASSSSNGIEAPYCWKMKIA
jgi:hypothetical protein